MKKKIVTHTYPEDYDEENLRGKEVSLHFSRGQHQIPALSRFER